jgi:nucleoside-diphosphate-sugar epimerase
VRVAVTGASGFVGGAACTALLRAGHDVVGLGRRPRPPGLPGAVDYRRHDLARGPAAGLPDVGAVVHCAASVDDWAPLAQQRPATVDGTRHALATWPRARFVHVSTASVYPPWRRGVVHEDDGPDASVEGPYSRAKAEAERVVAQAVSSGRDAIVLRPHAVYGPGDPTLLPRLLDAVRVVRGRRVLVVPGWSTTRIHLTSVELLARVCAVSVRSSVGGVVNVADAAPLPLAAALDQAFRAATGEAPARVHLPFPVALGLGTALEAVARARGATEPPLLTRYVVSHLAVSRELDLTRLRRELGVDPSPTDLRVLRPQP